MDISSFWPKVTRKLTTAQVKAKNPKAYKDAMARGLLDPAQMGPTEFAFDVVPSLNASGWYSDEDEEAFETGDQDTEIEDIQPSVTGDKALMLYHPEGDFLYTWVDPNWEGVNS